MPRRNLTSEQKEAVKAALAEGLAVTAVAARFGVTPQRISQIKREGASQTARALDPTTSLSVRLSRSEIRALDQLCERLGNRSRAGLLRLIVRNVAGVFSLTEREADTLRRSFSAVEKIGVNINQLARSVNGGQLRLTDEDRQLLRALSKDLGEISGRVRTVDGRLYRGARDLLELELSGGDDRDV